MAGWMLRLLWCVHSVVSSTEVHCAWKKILQICADQRVKRDTQHTLFFHIHNGTALYEMDNFSQHGVHSVGLLPWSHKWGRRNLAVWLHWQRSRAEWPKGQRGALSLSFSRFYAEWTILWHRNNIHHRSPARMFLQQPANKSTAKETLAKYLECRRKKSRICSVFNPGLGGDSCALRSLQVEL